MPEAIVTGATGILGRAIVKELSGQTSTWTKIYALSRSKKEDYPSTVHHHHVDLKGSAAELASQLKDVAAEYVFFAAYLASDSEEQLCKDNGAMLSNFLEALNISGASKRLKRVILVTGAKQYGVHFGTVKVPMEESDPWLDDADWPPNFYYVQQRAIAEAAKKSNGQWDWVVTYPNDVLGVAKGNFMNLATTLGIYAAVTREMQGEGGELLWPGSEKFYTQCYDSFTDSNLHAEFCAWAASAPADKVGNQAFNVVNGDDTTWRVMWPEVAKRFGLKVPKDMFQRKALDPSEMKLNSTPPIAAKGAAEMGLEGVYSQVSVEQRIDLVRWSERKDTQAAWEKLAEREKLDKDAFKYATWGFLGFVFGRPYDLIISMSKARKAGWTGYMNTMDSLNAAFDGLIDEKVLPKSI